jgi:predicted esterase
VTAINQAREDAQAAVRFFRRRAGTYGVDPTRIAIGGTSAGAITALNVGYKPDHPGASGNPGYSSAVGGALSLSGAVIFTGEVGPGDAPALLFHGTQDPLVPYPWAQDTVEAARPRACGPT